MSLSAVVGLRCWLAWIQCCAKWMNGLRCRSWLFLSLGGRSSPWYPFVVFEVCLRSVPSSALLPLPSSPFLLSSQPFSLSFLSFALLFSHVWISFCLPLVDLLLVHVLLARLPWLRGILTNFLYRALLSGLSRITGFVNVPVMPQSTGKIVRSWIWEWYPQLLSV